MNQSQDCPQQQATSGKVCFVQSYAKINLTLDVLGKRADGYHELATIMQTIDLYDTLCFTTTNEDRISMSCNRTELSNDNNLVVRAAQALRQKLGLRQGLTIELNKRVPVAAGLGGGSSNAAATLLALQRWWQLPVSMQELWEIAASLGSDVPFFLTGGLALCEGRGERITPLAAHWPAAMRWLLLVKPAIGVSTATVFRNLTSSDYTNGAWSRAIEVALQTQSGLQASDLYNSLERGVLAQYPEVAQARQEMLDAGAPYVRLSGSGPTLFSTFATLTEAAPVQQALHTQGYEVYLTRAINPANNDITYF
ncbi:4-diphosphocytidyl-2-C-methyl-D-erythritol kinase [Dictyobacter vulcani]|uniref:4-diphosphocytidyl-2-C-methyl-D-erythritol kinase n=1 Tax=Dictyobacter vulcani TaxID=2607529 RepID=A0A5J4KI25_9CHLR|nr:4-(cytidine 5'-diphospho)-2-C-methyl-D-erythritol kinase [Dictyobacter vulcani]GER89124.1 4-diphosphocytidyl-2-C-methyl-D-erythritol kinase [Dictyobacter vulcani]